MKAYLGISRPSSGEAHVVVTRDPADVLLLTGGRVSPIFATDEEPAAELRGDETIVIFFPLSPRALLAALATARSRGTLGGARTYMSHGLGSVVTVLPNGMATQDWVDRWSPFARAAESWPLVHHCVKHADISYYTPDVVSAERERRQVPIEEQLPDEVVIELEHFNRNVEYFWTRASRYAPEYRALVDALLDAVETTREAIVENLESGEGARFQQAHYVGVANLVEINSCLTMLTSQAMSGGSPVLESSFGVGEYSLLGIGGVARAAWRLYSHMADVFAGENHLERLRAMSTGPAFDASHQAPYALDIGSWKGDNIDAFDPPHDELGRQHVVYFSSRWGFHQTMQSISISWQCIPAGATPVWNLLTFSHEFLHSHLRELLDELLLDPRRSVDDIVDIFNKESADTWGESAVQLLVSELRWMRNTLALERAVSKDGSGHVTHQQRRKTDTTEVGRLVSAHLRDLEEIVVHVLDYVYFYDSNDEVFVSSLWHSWALIPNVQPQLEHYLLRTLLALSSTWPDTSSLQAFDDACARLTNAFQDLLDEQEHGLIREAHDLLSDPGMRRALVTRFQGSFTLVKFVKTYLVSARVNAHLFDDEQSLDDNTYRVQACEFTNDPVGSPIGLFLDLFRKYDRGRSREMIERETLWQFLEIT